MRTAHRVSSWLAIVACAAAAARAQVRLDETHRLVPTGTAFPLSAIGGDFDGDGALDVVLGDSEREAIGTVLLGSAGRFVRSESCPAEPRDFEFGVAGDVDGDGDLDLATTGGLQLNQGGCFVAAESVLAQAPNLGGISVALGDVDGDGDLDIVNGFPEPFGCEEPYVCNGFVALWRNDGAAGFVNASAQVVQLANQLPRSLALADFDGDADLDLYFNNHLLQNDGAGTFVDSSHQLPANAPFAWSSSAHAADFNGDGHADILDSANELYLNLGGAQFVLANAGLPGGWSADVADFDADGDLDCVAASNGDVIVLANDGAGAFVVAASATPSIPPYGVQLGDFDLDGDLDVFVVGDTFGELLFQDAAGRLVVPTNNLPAADIDALDVAIGDVDGDLDEDLYFACSGQDRLFLNDGSGVYSAAVLPADDEWSIHCGLVDFEGDGDLDALIGNGPNVPKRLMLNDGHGVFTAVPWGVTSDTTYDLAPGDLDNDGDLDVLAGYAYVANKVFLNDGAGNLTEGLGLWPSAPGGTSLALLDADWDGDLDAFSSHGVLRYFTNDGTGAFTLATQFTLGSGNQFGDVAVGDIDADGDTDAVASTGVSVRVLENNAGVFTLEPAVSASSGGEIELADLDGDGDLDALIARPIEIHLNDGQGNFSPAVAGLPYVFGFAGSASAGDLDEDGDSDVVLTGYDRPIVLSNLARHVAWKTPPAIGRTMELALHGPAHERFLLLAAHERAYVPLGSAGVLRLKRDSLALRRYGHFDAQGRSVVTHDVANDPSLAGTSLYWQALIANPRKLTNLEITTFVEL